jgi:tetratricopeptide (TPR) repeat protein
MSQAAETYQKLATIDAQGASRAAAGLADLALYEGRFADAAGMLIKGAAEDLSAKSRDRAAGKFAALAYVRLMQRNNDAAIAAAERALENSSAVKIRFLAARVFVDVGRSDKAKELAAGLTKQLPAEPQAYAKIIEANLSMKAKDWSRAISLLQESNTLLDTWIGHFDLGRAFLESGQLPQADGEFDRCIRRRGEALALFLDEEPTYGYLPPVYFYQGRVREAMKSEGFAESYAEYVKIRGNSTEDPLLPDVRRRASR